MEEEGVIFHLWGTIYIRGEFITEVRGGCKLFNGTDGYQERLFRQTSNVSEEHIKLISFW